MIRHTLKNLMIGHLPRLVLMGSVALVLLWLVGVAIAEVCGCGSCSSCSG
jgi:hypothetical protein